MSYQKRLHTKAVIRLKDNAIIGPENKREWRVYRKWLSEGNQPLPAEQEDSIVEVNQPTAEDKLAKLGLTKEDLKELLGL